MVICIIDRCIHINTTTNNKHQYYYQCLSSPSARGLIDALRRLSAKALGLRRRPMAHMGV